MALSDEQVKEYYGVEIEDLPTLPFYPRDNQDNDDMDEFDLLCMAVKEIDADAYEELYDLMYTLDSFWWSGDLRKCFLWEESPQGFTYWARLYRKLGEVMS